MTRRVLTTLAVYNEADYVNDVLDQVSRYSSDVLVVNDGSDDGTAELLAARNDIRMLTHERNRGYGAALRTAFDYAEREEFDVVVTIDCDGQHEPQRIPRFVAASHDADIVSGSRYMEHFPGDSRPPAERREVNREITDELNRRLGLQLTDSFCGFKAYRVDALSRLSLTEPGYAMPLELWVQAAIADMKIIELPIPLIYLDEKRSFGGALDSPDVRRKYYYQVIDRSTTEASADVPSSSETLCRESTG